MKSGCGKVEGRKACRWVEHSESRNEDLGSRAQDWVTDTTYQCLECGKSRWTHDSALYGHSSGEEG